MGQRHVLSSSVGISVRRGLNCPPILTGGQTNTIYSVHNTFIMSWSAIYIFSGKFVGFNDFSGNITSFVAFSAHHFGRNFKPSYGFSLSTVVWKNGDTRAKAHFHDLNFQSLTKGIDDICAHRVTYIHNDINNILFWVNSIQLSDPDVRHTSTSFHHVDAHTVQSIHQFLFFNQNLMNLLWLTRRNMNLTDHNTGSWRWKEWEWSQELSDWTARGHHRGLFNAHRNHKFLFVDHKLGNNRKRQREHSNHIFSHRISDTEFQTSCYQIIDLDFRVDLSIHELNSIQNRHFI